MSMALVKEVTVPEWESAGVQSRQTGPGTTGKSTVLAGIKQRFDTMMPAHRKYVGMTRRLCLLVSLAIFLTLLALIIGLAVGLSRRSQ